MTGPPDNSSGLLFVASQRANRSLLPAAGRRWLQSGPPTRAVTLTRETPLFARLVGDPSVVTSCVLGVTLYVSEKSVRSLISQEPLPAV